MNLRKVLITDLNGSYILYTRQIHMSSITGDIHCSCTVWYCEKPVRQLSEEIVRAGGILLGYDDCLCLLF